MPISTIAATWMDITPREEQIELIAGFGICFAFWAGCYITSRRFAKLLKENSIPFKSSGMPSEKLKAESCPCSG
jgi:hypothetical protein